MHYKVILIIISLLSSFTAVSAENFSIYLVRHAEKQQSLKDSEKYKDPLLTSCGVLRAKQLARLLSSANIESIYSTSYQRTIQTASPLANELNVAIKSYNPRNLDQLALLLKQRKQSVLVVGHSNTTPLLAQLLSGIKVKAIHKENYQMLYQIQFISEKATLTKLIQPLLCNNSTKLDNSQL